MSTWRSVDGGIQNESENDVYSQDNKQRKKIVCMVKVFKFVIIVIEIDFFA